MSSRITRSKVQNRQFEPERVLTRSKVQKRRLEPEKVITRAQKQSRTHSEVFDSNDFVFVEILEEEELQDASQDFTELCANPSIVVEHLHSMSSVSVAPTVAVHQHTEVEFQIHPTQWQVLGFIDAEVTENYIDNSEIQTHKLCIHPNFELFINKTRTKSLFDLVLRSYLQTLDYADIVPTERFGNNSSFTEMAVLTRGKIKPKTILPGLKGFLAKISEDELQEDKSFSVFAPASNYKHTRIMLGPASFVNHDCNPNARFIVEGEKSASTVAIQAIKTIGAGEEITVSYGENYFGDDNINCRCVVCQQTSSLDVTAPLFETISEVSAARTFSPPKDNNCERDDVVASAEVSSVNISAPPPDFVCEPAVVGSVEFEVDNIDERDEVVVSAEVSSEVPSVNISAPPDQSISAGSLLRPVVGSVEFEVDNIEAEEFEVDQQVRRIKTVKTDEVVECLICHVTVKRIDRHLKQHRDTICEREERFLIDFYRTRNAPKSKKV